jgi:YegS/Rv2252/BmrU family lipid kinase
VVIKIKFPYRTAFIINPTGGGGHAGKVWPKIARLLDKSGQTYSAYLTREQGDGTWLAAKAAKEGAELVVAVGGDGTISEVLNGIELKKTILGIIPLGTGNGFRHSTAIPGQWEEALYGLSSWSPRLVDVGRVNKSLFLNVVGVGFDAAVEQLASGKYHSLKGFLAYIPAFIEELASFKHFKASLNYNKHEQLINDALLVLISNGAYYGGQMSIAPQASIDDGELDLTLIRNIQPTETAVLAAQALLKRPFTHDSVSLEKLTKIVITAEDDVPIHIDGEVVGSQSIEIEIIPKALKLLAP